MKEKVFLRAFWESPNSALIFLVQDWDTESLRLPLYLEPESIVFEIERASVFDVSRLSGYYVCEDTIRFLVDPTTYSSIDFEENIYVGGQFNGWEEAIGKEEYRLYPYEMDGHPVFIVDLPVSILEGAYSSFFRFVSEHNRWLSVPENAPNLVPNRFQGSDFMLSLKQSGRHVFRLRTTKEINLKSHVSVGWKNMNVEDHISVSNAEFYLSLKSELPMGVTQHKGKTIFRLFAPRANRISLELFKNLKNPEIIRHPLSKNKDGSWEIVCDENYDRYFYYYYVDGINYDGSTYFDSTVPVVDPYAKAMASSKGPGIVITPDLFPSFHDGFHPPLWHDLVIAEVHMRDLMANSRLPLTKSDRKQYTGMINWLREEGNYLRSLGVNAVEFQPLQEFEYESKDEYHWGYMPVNFFSPSSANEKYPKTGEQIRSFQEMVCACHDAGFAFILDVVYNHLGTPNALYSIDKHYYFEIDSFFNLMNWSGVGNDIRCRSPMTKRLIIDSLVYFVTQFGVDGFRFDLGELLGRDVLVEIEKALKKVKPSIILIAEPWSFRGHIAEKLKPTGFSSWNDHYRDFFVHYLKGEASPLEFTYFIKGSPGGLTRFPAQTVNYSESHDDYCWIDLITENLQRDGVQPTLNDIKRTHLMFSMLFVSLGIPMIAAGQDFLKSKRGLRNTYQRGDINALDYERLTQFSSTHEYVRNWIAFRLSAEGHLFRKELQPAESYFCFFFGQDSGRAMAAIFNADRSSGNSQAVYTINPTLANQVIDMQEYSMEGAKQIADHYRFCSNGLDSALIEIKENIIHLPPLTCGLWLKR
jgi:pullulanase